MPRTDPPQPCVKCGGELIPTAEELLSEPGYGFVKEIRPGQIELTKAIEQALEQPGHIEVFAEGGCGVGKTFAYGTPAVLTGMRVIISTAKKSLQDQLETKDIPFLQKKLGHPRQFVSLKGKSNYVCKRLVKKERSLFEKNDQLDLWQRLSDWMEQDAVGDLSAFPGELEFPATICTAEECIGRCKIAKQCGYYITKETMRDADLVVTNHSLLGFDLRFGVGRLLGPYQVLIIDEAHAAPDYLRRAFSEEVSETWLRSFLKKLGREQVDTPSVSESKDVPKWEALFQGIPEERLLPPNFFDADLLKYNLDTLSRLRTDLSDTVRKRWAPNSRETDFAKLCKDAEETIFGEGVDLGTIDGGADSDTEYEDLIALVKHYTKVESNFSALNSSTGNDPDYINCREETATGKVKVVRQPVNLIPFVRGPLKAIDKVIFASATLNAPILKSELGMTPAVEITQPSPFNYKANGLVYIPQHLPRPDDEGWPFAIAQEMVQLIRAAQGNALVLFSAKNDMVRTLEEIEQNFEMDGLPIFAQTEGSRPKEIMRQFEETEHASIFGLKSFFEGIDIQGLKLRLVILTKIPFPHMKDPLCQAKKQQLEGRWWSEYYYPTMLTDVQQAAGRLIRTATDRGVLCIFDVRMWVGSNKNLDATTVGTPTRPWKGYGYNIFRALPFSNYTPRRELTLKFLKSLASPST
jgi:Rad3-related DNA helicase